MAEMDMEAPVLSQEEWALVAQLLENKQHVLLAEIRHTDKRAFRDALKERLEQVDHLLEKLPVMSQKGS
jgi:hypothetical protein